MAHLSSFSSLRRPTPLFALLVLLAACGARSAILPVEQEEETDPSTEPTGDGRCHSICRCLDGTTVLTAPEPSSDGSCLNACDTACQPHVGVQNALSSKDGLGEILYCEELCGRVDALGCASSCRDLIGGRCVDVSPSGCDPDIDIALKCIATTSVLTCEGDNVRVDFCPSQEVAFCEGG